MSLAFWSHGDMTFVWYDWWSVLLLVCHSEGPLTQRVCFTSAEEVVHRESWRKPGRLRHTWAYFVTGELIKCYLSGFTISIYSKTSVFSFRLYIVRNDRSVLSFLHIECFFPSTSLWSFVSAYWFSSTNICCQLPHPVVWLYTNSFYYNGHHVRCSWSCLCCHDTRHQHMAEARVTAVHAACSSEAMTRSSVSFLVLTLCLNEDYMSC